jgi:hypothetical protein
LNQMDIGGCIEEEKAARFALSDPASLTGGVL